MIAAFVAAGFSMGVRLLCALFDARHKFIDQALDLLGRCRRARGQAAHLAGDNREAAPCSLARRYFLNVSPKKSPLFQVGLPGVSAMSRPML